MEYKAGDGRRAEALFHSTSSAFSKRSSADVRHLLDRKQEASEKARLDATRHSRQQAPKTNRVSKGPASRPRTVAGDAIVACLFNQLPGCGLILEDLISARAGQE